MARSDRQESSVWPVHHDRHNTNIDNHHDDEYEDDNNDQFDYYPHNRHHHYRYRHQQQKQQEGQSNRRDHEENNVMEFEDGKSAILSSRQHSYDQHDGQERYSDCQHSQSTHSRSHSHSHSPEAIVNGIEDAILSILQQLDQQQLPSFPPPPASPSRAARSSSSNSRSPFLSHLEEEEQEQEQEQPTSSSNRIRTGAFIGTTSISFTIGHTRSMTSMLLVASFCFDLLLQRRTATTRQVYYVYCTHFRNQVECNTAITNLCTRFFSAHVRIPRMALGLTGSPKGWYFLQSLAPPSTKTCHSSSTTGTGSTKPDRATAPTPPSRMGWPITHEWLQPLCQSSSSSPSSLSSSQQCIFSNLDKIKGIVIIEKEGVYHRLCEDILFHNHNHDDRDDDNQEQQNTTQSYRRPLTIQQNLDKKQTMTTATNPSDNTKQRDEDEDERGDGDSMILFVTGKGFPDWATRAMVHTIWTRAVLSNKNKIKKKDLFIWGLCDCNPYGFSVLQTYRNGYDDKTINAINYSKYDNDDNFGVPVEWIGLKPSVVENELYQDPSYPRSVFQQLTDLDRKKLKSLIHKATSTSIAVDITDISERSGTIATQRTTRSRGTTSRKRKKGHHGGEIVSSFQSSRMPNSHNMLVENNSKNNESDTEDDDDKTVVEKDKDEFNNSSTCMDPPPYGAVYKSTSPSECNRGCGMFALDELERLGELNLKVELEALHWKGMTYLSTWIQSMIQDKLQQDYR